MHPCLYHHEKVFGFQKLGHFTHWQPLESCAELKFFGKKNDFILELWSHDWIIFDCLQGQSLWLHTATVASFAGQLEEKVNSLATLVECLGAQTHNNCVLDLFTFF